MDKIKENIGFENRAFLFKKEWETYLRRKPVRYIRKKSLIYVKYVINLQSLIYCQFAKNLKKRGITSIPEYIPDFIKNM